MNTILERIQARMKEKGMTIYDLAKETGIDHLLLFEIFGKLHGLQGSQLLLILKALDMDFCDLK